MQLSWSDPRLSVASDSRRTARYRLLQSWYREQVLNAEYGDYRVNGGTRPLGSLLALDDVVERPGLNFLTRERRGVRPRARRHRDRRPAARSTRRGWPATCCPACRWLLDLRRAPRPPGPRARRRPRLPRPARGRGRGDGVRLAAGGRRARRPVRLRRRRDHAARRRQPPPGRHRGEVHRAVQPHHLQQRRLPAGARVQRLVPPRYGAAAARPGHQPALAHQPARGGLRAERASWASARPRSRSCAWARTRTPPARWPG